MTNNSNRQGRGAASSQTANSDRGTRSATLGSRLSALGSQRLPAEWEPQEAVIISWPHPDTDWAYMLDEVTRCYVDLAKAIVPYARLIIICPDIDTPSRHLADLPQDRIIYFRVDTNDTWVRDYGPITTVESRESRAESREYCDFKFNGWGLKFAADRDNLVTSDLCAGGLLAGQRHNMLSFVLEGGSIESDGCGTLLTTSQCLLSPNRNGAHTKEEIERILLDTFGAQRVLWLDHGALSGDDTDSHIDTLARLAPDNTILYVGCDDPDDEHYASLLEMKRQLATFRTLDGDLPYNLIELPLPDPIYDEDGNRLPATYANYLPLNNAILLPVYGQPKKDLLATQIMKIVFPGHDIITVDCRPLIKQHGSLHCATMQLPLNSLKI